MTNSIKVFDKVSINRFDWWQTHRNTPTENAIMADLMLANCVVWDPILQQYQDTGKYNWDDKLTITIFSTEWLCFFLSELYEYNPMNFIWNKQDVDLFGDNVKNQDKCTFSFWKQHNINLDNKNDKMTSWLLNHCASTETEPGKISEKEQIICEVMETLVIYNPDTCYWEMSTEEPELEDVQYIIGEPFQYVAKTKTPRLYPDQE